MKKLLSATLCAIMLFAIAAPAMAVNDPDVCIPRTGSVEYDLEDLVGEMAGMPRASASKTATAGTVMAHRMDGTTGEIVGASPTFTFTGIPTGAKITNVEAWNPLASNISHAPVTTVENIRVYCAGKPSEWMDLWTITKPSAMYPCSTSSLNGELAKNTYYIEILGNVRQNQSGIDGFTVKGIKVRVTYTY